MTTEITTKMKQVVPTSVDQRHMKRGVTAVHNSTGKQVESRQELPITGQSIPPTKDTEQTTERQFDKSNLDQVVDDLNNYAQNLKREIRFSVDEESGRTIITVIDGESKEIVRQIPPEDITNVSRNLQAHHGVFVQVQV